MMMMMMANRKIAITHHRCCHCKWPHVVSFWLTFFLLVTCLLNSALPEAIYRVDPLALLAATLRTYQRAGCDSEQLTLACPRGTSISIELAQYGRAGDLSDHSLCPPISQEDLTTIGSASDDVLQSSTQIEVKIPETCTVSGLQYALLQMVVDACQKKRHCKFSANPKTISNTDPCSGIRKFVEIAYKCRPYEFRSKVACENDNMPLVCNPYSRIAIYSASFGHTEQESVQCGHDGSLATEHHYSANNRQTCLASYATETVMQICHGRRRCSITADAGTFGRPCKNDVRMYLKVMYTCIPRKVLKDRYETKPEGDEPQQSDLDMDHDELYDEDQFYKESEAIPPAPKIQGAIPNPAYPFDFNVGDDGMTSTLMPPLLSRNDSSLEEIPSAVDWFRRRFKVSYTENEDISTDIQAPSTRAVILNVSEVSGEEFDAANEFIDTQSKAKGRNFIYKRRCQMQDDWGKISLNCTDDDIIIEQVEVIGFLLNWLQALDHIQKNQEQFYLYLIISVAVGLVLCLTLVIGRLTIQKKYGCFKSSNNSSNGDKKANTTVNVTGGSRKFQKAETDEIKLPNSFGDDISDIDADIDLTSPMPVHSLSTSRNEPYMTYAPTQSCAYGNFLPHSSANLTATTVLMPATTHQHGAMLLAGQSCGKQKIGAAIGEQSTPPLSANTPFYTSMGVCSPTITGTMTMGPHMFTSSALNSSLNSSTTAPYITNTMMTQPVHQHVHHGSTLRRTLIPTSVGMMSTASPSLTTGSITPHSRTIGAVPSSSGIYYDSTMPRNLSRGLSADSTQYFYG